MDVDISYLPAHYFSSDPDNGGFFPFAIEGPTNYVFDIGNIYLPDDGDCWLPMWMKNLSAFPLYCCMEVPSYWKEEFEEICKSNYISYKSLAYKKKSDMKIAEVYDLKQFQMLLPFCITIGSSNSLALWSTNRAAFSVEKRKWKGNWFKKFDDSVVVHLEKGSSVFWVGYDGTSIAVISNNHLFSTYEKLISTFPEDMKPTFWELE